MLLLSPNRNVGNVTTMINYLKCVKLVFSALYCTNVRDVHNYSLSYKWICFYKKYVDLLFLLLCYASFLMLDLLVIAAGILSKDPYESCILHCD